MGPSVEGVLQNLTLMVDNGKTTDVSDTDTQRWGWTINHGARPNVARSGVCQTSTGQIQWIGDPAMGAASYAAAMVEAGCLRGMELDINPMWVSFALFVHPDAANRGTIVGRNLYPGMHFPPDVYRRDRGRNWLMLTSR